MKSLFLSFNCFISFSVYSFDSDKLVVFTRLYNLLLSPFQTQDKNMPTFSNMGKNWYSDTVPENIELHSPLSVQIQATSPMSRKLIYSIVKGNELEEFAVDFNTGMLRLLSIHL